MKLQDNVTPYVATRMQDVRYHFLDVYCESS